MKGISEIPTSSDHGDLLPDVPSFPAVVLKSGLERRHHDALGPGVLTSDVKASCTEYNTVTSHQA